MRSGSKPREKFVAYVTQYALTAGIQAMLVEDCFDVGHNMVAQVGHQGLYFCLPHWHRTPEEALAQAERMRVAAIASAEKKIARLRKMTFTVPEYTP